MAAHGLDFPQTPGPDVYQALNPIDLPRIDRTAVTSAGADGICLEAGDQRRVFERYGAAFVDDPDEAGLFAGGIGRSPYWYPPAYTAAVGNAALVGYRTILTADRRFFTDEAYEEPLIFQNQLARISRPDPFSNEATGLRPTGPPGFFQFEPGGRAHRHIEGVALVLCSDEPFSYGSFLFRVVPKVWAVRRLGLTDITCIAYTEQKPFMDLLNLSGIPQSNIVLHDIDIVTHIDRAVVPCLRNPHAYLDPESCELYAELRASYGTRPAGRKVYVSRRSIGREGWSSRIMVNEGELITRLEAMGFDIIEPENLTVRDQIRVFSSAEIIVGPSGSGLFNTMFCHPGTKVIDIQSEPQWIYSYTGMYASLRLRYGIFVGKADPADVKPVHRRWTVNIEALIARIRAFLAE